MLSWGRPDTFHKILNGPAILFEHLQVRILKESRQKGYCDFPQRIFGYILNSRTEVTKDPRKQKYCCGFMVLSTLSCIFPHSTQQSMLTTETIEYVANRSYSKFQTCHHFKI